MSYVSQLCIISHGSFKTLFVAGPGVNESDHLYCLSSASGTQERLCECHECPRSAREQYAYDIVVSVRKGSNSKRNRFSVIIVGGELKAVLVYLSFLSGPLLFYCSRHCFLWLFQVSLFKVAVREYTHHVLTIPVPCQSNRVLRSTPRT